MNISQKKLEKSKGRLEIKIKDQNLQKLYQQGSSKALMPDFHENLKQLISDKQKLEKQSEDKEQEMNLCEQKIMQLHKRHGSSEQKLSHTLEQQHEFRELEQDFAAYHLFMVCCHPNGVSYEIIKERLPYINQEISKILTNIVEFEVFISNN